METSPVFYVTERLRDAIIQSELKGIKAYLEVEISVSENFHELFPGKVMPHMYHLIIDGQPYINDFGVDEGYLIILSNTKNLLDNFDLSDAQVEQV